MQPLYRVELKQGGKWQQHPIGWCGTGMDELEIARKARNAAKMQQVPLRPPLSPAQPFHGSRLTLSKRFSRLEQAAIERAMRAARAG